MSKVAPVGLHRTDGTEKQKKAAKQSTASRHLYIRRRPQFCQPAAASNQSDFKSSETSPNVNCPVYYRDMLA